MTKKILLHALVNAFLTAGYIILIVFILFDVIPRYFSNEPDTIIAPIMMLMLFVLSAAITSSLLLGRPILWYVDGKKREAVTLLIATLVSFFTCMLIVMLIYLLLRTPQSQSFSTGQFLSRYNVTYTINGERLPLQTYNAHKKGIEYFGNELRTDIDNDGMEDIVFIGTYALNETTIQYYVLGALQRDETYVATDAYFLGGNIAPQSTSKSQNVRHKNVIVVSYADRKPNEPITVPASVGKSVYLKLDTSTKTWGIVVPDFEGESR